MRILVIRVKQAAVSAGFKRIASIGKGLALFVGVDRTDSEATAGKMAERIVNLRVFENELGKLDYSVQEKKYQILCVPNFSLCAGTGRGRGPSFDKAMKPQYARRLFENFILLLSSYNITVESGAFGEHMDIDMILDGPLNLVIESP